MNQGLLHSKILSFASHIPDNFVSIDEFAAVGDLPGKLDLHRLTGIEGHRKSDAEEGSLELAIKAAEKSMTRAEIEPEEIDLVINCAVSNLSGKLGLHISPSMATIIAKELGIEEAICFDISNACSGMMTSLMIADSMIKSGEISTALIVSGENITSLIDEAKSNNLWLKSKAIASMTVGDGSAAYLLGKSETPNQVIFSEPFTFAQYNKLCIGEASKKRAGPLMRTKASQLQQGVLDNLSEFLTRSMQHMGLDWTEINHVYSHPTSPKAVEKGAEIAVATMGPIMQLHNISHDIANTASTSHCMLLEKSLQAGKLKSGDSTLLISFGSGLAMLSMYFHLPEGIEQWL